MLPTFAYVRPQSLEQALEQLRTDGARVSAGSSDFLGCLRDEVFHCAKVVSIAGLEELRGIQERRDGSLRIGALTPVASIASNPIIAERYRVLSQAAGEVASPQLRNQGTIGGNICQRPRCWYFRGEFQCLRKGGSTCYAIAGENQYHAILGGSGCFIVHPSDTAPALMALGASVRIASAEGERVVPIDDFFVPPSVDVQRENVLDSKEIVTEILLPRPQPGLRSSYRKVRARGSWDFALAGVALALQFRGQTVVDGRIVLSGAAPVPWRSRPAEATIVGAGITTERAAAAGAAAMQGATPLKRNGYKVPLFRGVIEEELLQLARA